MAELGIINTLPLSAGMGLQIKGNVISIDPNATIRLGDNSKYLEISSEQIQFYLYRAAGGDYSEYITTLNHVITTQREYKNGIQISGSKLGTLEIILNDIEFNQKIIINSGGGLVQGNMSLNSNGLTLPFNNSQVLESINEAQNGAVTPDLTKSIPININGVDYKLIIAE